MPDLPNLDEIALAKLAREMAMNIRPVQQIFTSFGIDETEYYEIQKLDFYKRTLEHFLIEWNATTATADRLKFQSQAGLEQLLPMLIKRAMDGKEPLVAANETGKLVARLGGIGEPKVNGQGNAGERFVITINLGADVDGKAVVEKYDKSIDIDVNDVPGKVGVGYEKAQLTSAQDIALASLMEKG